jgi:hypothetical protein
MVIDYQTPGAVELVMITPDFPFTNVPKQPDQIKETVITVADTDSRFVYATGSVDSPES